MEILKQQNSLGGNQTARANKNNEIKQAKTKD